MAEFKRIEVTDPAHADVLNEKIVEPAIELAQEVNKNAEDIAEVDQKVDAHVADDTIHKTSDVIRTETETKLKVEVVSSSGSETPEQGRIIFDMSQGKFFGGNGSEWV